jgi:hypothetical protein
MGSCHDSRCRHHTDDAARHDDQAAALLAVAVRSTAVDEFALHAKEIARGEVCGMLCSLPIRDHRDIDSRSREVRGGMSYQ